VTSPEKKLRGRPRGPVSEKRVQDAISLLKRSDLPPAEIARHFAGDPTPDDLLAALKAKGCCAAEVTLPDIAALRPGQVIRVELVPLEDGVNPVETLMYLPDLLQSCVKELSGIRKHLQTLAGKGQP
jgi:hypothetical protein